MLSTHFKPSAQLIAATADENTGKVGKTRIYFYPQRSVMTAAVKKMNFKFPWQRKSKQTTQCTNANLMRQ